jgi:hypothetical protein
MMRKTFALISIGAAALAFATSAMAEPLNAQPGAWKVVVDTMSNGKVLEPRVNTTCLTKEQIENFSNKVAQPRKSATQNCQRTSFKQTPSTVDWTYQCTGDRTITTVASLKFDNPTHYSGKMKTSTTVHGQTIDTLNTLNGTRIGDCPTDGTVPGGH